MPDTTNKITSAVSLFSQSEVWVDRNGTQRPIAEMDGPYVANVISFVRRRHEGYASQYVWDMLHTLARAAALDVSHDVFHTLDTHAEVELTDIRHSSLLWIETTPLMLALKARLTAIGDERRRTEGYL